MENSDSDQYMSVSSQLLAVLGLKPDNMSADHDQFIIRDAKRSDCKAIHSFIIELAVYENLADQVELTVEQLEEDGFGDGHPPRYHVLVVDQVEVRSKPDPKPTNTVVVGYLLYLRKYSTFKGTFLWMEDLYVKPAYRRYGLGQSLVKALIRKAHSERMPRIEWNVLAWNQLAIDFYRKKLGAYDLTVAEDWHTFRLTNDRFETLLKSENIPDNVRIESSQSI